MTEQELEMWQHIDMLRDQIEQLQKQMDDQVKAFTVAINLIADSMEKKHGE